MFDVSKTLVFIVVGSALTLGCGNNHEQEGETESLNDTLMSSTMSESGDATDTSINSSSSTSGTTSGSTMGTGTESSETDQDPICPEVMTGRVYLKDAETERFRCLREVHGTLVVMKTELKDFQVLSNLNRVTDSLQILNNPHPQSLSGLENLVHVGGQLIVGGNSQLSDLRNLASLRTVRSFAVRESDSLSDLTSLVGEFPNTTGERLRDINIGPMPTTLHLAGLESITLFEGKFLIHHNENLLDLQGLSSAMTGARPLTDLQLRKNPSLESFAGLENLTEMGRFEMTLDPSLRSMQGLNNLRKAREFYIGEEEGLETLEGLESLEEVGRLGIGSCKAHAAVGSPNLHSIASLRSLKRVEEMHLVGSGLETLEGLEGLESVDYLTIAANPRLPGELVDELLARLDVKASLNCGNLGQTGPCSLCRSSGEGARSLKDEALGKAAVAK